MNLVSTINTINHLKKEISLIETQGNSSHALQ